MYNFLLDHEGLESDQQLKFTSLRAAPGVLAQRGQVRHDFCNLSPLQLATLLGDKRLFQHVLRRNAVMQWKWGPVTSFELDLNGLDSYGDSGNDVMEIVGRLDARLETREMLLHEFMEGFLHTLFVDKWNRFGCYWFAWRRFLDLAYFVVLVIYIFCLKYTLLSPFNSRLAPAILLCFNLFLFTRDLNACYLYFDNFRKRPQFTKTEEDKSPSPEGSPASSSQTARDGKAKVKERVINSAESATGMDLDGDGDVGVAGSSARTANAAAPAPAEENGGLLSDLADAIQDVAEDVVEVVEDVVDDTVDDINDFLEDTVEILNPLRAQDVLFPLLKWAQSHMMSSRVLGQLCVSITCLVMLFTRHPLELLKDAAVNVDVTGSSAEAWEQIRQALANSTYEQLNAASHDPIQSIELRGFLMGVGYTDYTFVCVPLAIGLYCWSISFLNLIFIPNQRLGILWRSMMAMIVGDVTAWMILLSCTLFTFGLVVFMCYPVQWGSSSLGLVATFDEGFVPSFKGLLELALLGVELDFDPTQFMGIWSDESYNTTIRVDTIFFLLAYLFYMIFALVLLLNLLIAMMSTTYESIMECAVLEWRVDFARMILKIELECEWLVNPPNYFCGLVKPWDLHAGERTPDGKRYLLEFKNVSSNVEGIEIEGGTEIFGGALDEFKPQHLSALLPAAAMTQCGATLDLTIPERPATARTAPTPAEPPVAAPPEAASSAATSPAAPEAVQPPPVDPAAEPEAPKALEAVPPPLADPAAAPEAPEAVPPPPADPAAAPVAPEAVPAPPADSAAAHSDLTI